MESYKSCSIRSREIFLTTNKLMHIKSHSDNKNNIIDDKFLVYINCQWCFLPYFQSKPFRYLQEQRWKLTNGNWTCNHPGCWYHYSLEKTMNHYSFLLSYLKEINLFFHTCYSLPSPPARQKIFIWYATKKKNNNSATKIINSDSTLKYWALLNSGHLSNEIKHHPYKIFQKNVISYTLKRKCTYLIF